MRKEYTTISLPKDLYEEIEQTRKQYTFYSSAGEFVRRAIEIFIKESTKK